MLELLTHLGLFGTLLICIVLYSKQKNNIDDTLVEMRKFLNRVDCSVKRFESEYSMIYKQIEYLNLYVKAREEKAAEEKATSTPKSAQKKK
jgi:hypothetical protein